MKLFAFEDIGEDLDLMPLCARRAADVSGRKPSLASWRSLPHATRLAVCEAGSAAQVDAPKVQSLLAAGNPRPEPCPPVGAVSSEVVPAGLLEALGTERPLPVAAFSALTPLERYVLAKLGARGAGERLNRAYDEIVGVSGLATHLDAQGSARMVSVSEKRAGVRHAVATSRVSMNEDAFGLLERADAPKGDVLGTARLAGIMGAKRTAELVPLCHPIALTRIDVRLELEPATRSVEITCRVEAFDRTGVEMEALTAASVSALTVYDMLKAFDRGMQIGPTLLLEKGGGRNDFKRRQEPLATEAAPEKSTTSRFALRDQRLSVGEVLELVAQPSAGASVVFVGTVRNHSQGRPVVKLEYEAYATMAVAELERIAGELEREFAGVRLAAVHRTGSLEVGEVAVLCAASAPHRDAAFDAARALIDRTKARVPIWKREHGQQGPYWVGWEDARTSVSPSLPGSPNL